MRSIFKCSSLISRLPALLGAFLVVSCEKENPVLTGQSTGSEVKQSSANNEATTAEFNLNPGANVLFTLPNTNALSNILCGNINGTSAATPCARLDTFGMFLWRVSNPLVATYRDLTSYSGFKAAGLNQQKGTSTSAIQTTLQSNAKHYSFYLDTRDRLDTFDSVLNNGQNPRTHITAGLGFNLITPTPWRTTGMKPWIKPWKFLTESNADNLEWLVAIKVGSSSGRYQDANSQYVNAIPYIGSNIVFAYRTGINKDANGNDTKCPITSSIHYGAQIYDPRYDESKSVEQQPSIKPSISLDGVSENSHPGSASINVSDIPHPNNGVLPIENTYSWSLPGSSGMKANPTPGYAWTKIKLTRQKFAFLLNKIADKTQDFLAPECKNYLTSIGKLNYRFSENPDDYYIDYFTVGGEISISTNLSKTCTTTHKGFVRGCGHLGWDVGAMALRACPTGGCD